MDENRFWLQTNTRIILGILVLFALVGFCGERENARDAAIREQLAKQPPVQTCVTHSPLDSVNVIRK